MSFFHTQGQLAHFGFFLKESVFHEMEKLIFTNTHFNMKVRLEKDTERERKKANSVFQIAQRICPLRQSWGENVPITFELNFQ